MSSEITTPLRALLDQYRAAAKTNREAGTYFEELTLAYLRTEPAHKELYATVEPYAVWAARRGLDKRDAGIDLMAETVSGDMHAIQCKLYASDYKLQKADIDSFFTASGKKPFVHRIIVSTTDLWSDHAEDALRDQTVPVNKIDLSALENSVIDWSAFTPTTSPTIKAKKDLRPHQRDAISIVAQGLADADRGKLIMACGTGKTFTSLKFAESFAGAGKRVLFLVPSLSLLSQTLTEWTQESHVPLRSFAVCSDSAVGKKRKKDDDAVQTPAHELAYPATTDPKHLAAEVLRALAPDHMTVVFATYHSIAVLHDAQHGHGLGDFDLIVCDEAHRTTGAKSLTRRTRARSSASTTARTSGARSALYMTATPRIFGDTAKATAERDSVTLYSMDDEALYGKNLFVLTFSEAVKRDLLVDYKVVVVAVEEAHVSRLIQELLADEDNDLRVDDAAKIVGCWKALAKQGLTEELAGDDAPMKRAVAFCRVILPNPAARSHKVASVSIAGMFQAVVEAYQASETPNERAVRLRCEAAHIDGGMNASQKEAKIDWLKAPTPDDTCRILSNVRCLSEGVDVPALDAVLFLTPRDSQVDVVQSVGRIMRKAPGKKRGYIVLPVVIPAGIEPHEALNDNQTYKEVWQVLNALRSHDDRFNAMVNKLALTGADPRKMEVIAVSDKVPARRSKVPKSEQGQHAARTAARSGRTIGSKANLQVPVAQQELLFEIGEIERAIYAKLVSKVGNRHHWEDWAKDIAQIARTHIDRITGILENPANTKEHAAFDAFARELRDDLNDSISREEIIEMLSQHLVTRPVFDALFAGHSFATENSMSKAMQGVLDVLDAHRLDKETSTIQAFYDSVKLRAEGIDNAAGKQKIVVELYDKFFRNAFPKMSERLGIVYTPVEIVDFILHSVDHLLRTEFGQTLGSEGVHILDPFTGTGTFITRLLQSGLIADEELPRKYAAKIHANEIVLMAYYFAAINIEAVYHDLGGEPYTPFEVICLTDTFQLYEKEDLVAQMLADNSARRVRQKKLDIRVIVGNPPYSVGQQSAIDNNQNVAYPGLDARIRATYAERSDAVLKTSLYDSYIRSIRWASDRVGDRGIVGFVTNGSFVDATTANGLRRCLAEEFSSLYIFHLRGNQRTSGERSREEGGKVFGSGSRAPVAISVLVRNPEASEHGHIYFRDVGDYLTREEKLEAVRTFVTVAGIADAGGWTRITPDAHGDWLKQRDEGFTNFIVMGDKKGGETALFETYSNGVKTQSDAWAYNPSRRALLDHMGRTVAFHEAERLRFHAAHRAAERAVQEVTLDGFLATDPTKISWTRALRSDLLRNKPLGFDNARATRGLYRPFAKEWLYSDRRLNEIVGLMPRLFPVHGSGNRAVGVTAPSNRAQFSTLMTADVPSLETVSVAGGSQFFPLYVYETDASTPDDAGDDAPAVLPLLAAEPAPRYNPKASTIPTRRDGITDAGLAHFQLFYPSQAITKEDVFYYVYGLLHSPDYRERYADNLGKELPRIPRVKSAVDFRAFVEAGRKLGDLHVGYEAVPEYPAHVEGPSKPTTEQLRVEKMKFGKGKDKTVIHYDAFFTVRDIPIAAYEYVVNGKPAIEWVMERQAVTTDKASGIVKDANAWATETMGDGPEVPAVASAAGDHGEPGDDEDRRGAAGSRAGGGVIGSWWLDG